MIIIIILLLNINGEQFMDWHSETDVNTDTFIRRKNAVINCEHSGRVLMLRVLFTRSIVAALAARPLCQRRTIGRALWDCVTLETRYVGLHSHPKCTTSFRLLYFSRLCIVIFNNLYTSL